MRREWSKYHVRWMHERPLSDILEECLGSVEEEPLTNLMAEEYLRMNWTEIGTAFGITGTAAKLRYEKIIAKLRRRAGV